MGLPAMSPGNSHCRGFSVRHQTRKMSSSLGDSITYAGGYAEDIEAYYVTRFPEQHFEFVNVGLSSETVSGLSEEGHAGGQVVVTGTPEDISACAASHTSSFLRSRLRT